MRTIICFVFSVFILTSPIGAQVILSDFSVNNPAQNTKGVGPTAVAVGPNGFAVAWQDWNDYGVPVPATPRVAVQLFAANAAPIGPLNLFNGESRSAIIYLDDYLTGHIDLEFTPNGTLLVAVKHEGLYDSFTNWIWSYESGIGAVNTAGQIIDMLAGAGVIQWYWANDLIDNGNMRLAMTPAGNFLATVNGASYDTDYSAVLIQQYDANANLVGPYFTPHTNDPGPNHNHVFPDIATNGAIHLVVWQDGRLDQNYDITAQFYDNASAIGGNLAVNSGDPANTFNLTPSVSMNSSGNSVVVWVDSREGLHGEVFGQRYNSSGQAEGNNFQISTGEGAMPLYERPEVAMRENGSFMVVWTDSIIGSPGHLAYRAKARQFDASGNPNGQPFVLPETNIQSGYPSIATDGAYYYCAWQDVRLDNTTPNIFASVVGDINFGIEPVQGKADGYYLAKNYPNPVISSTTIQFSVPHSSRITLKIFDVSGKEINTLVDEIFQKGEHKFLYDASKLLEGVYFYQIEAFGPDEKVYFTDTGRLVKMK